MNRPRGVEREEEMARMVMGKGSYKAVEVRNRWGWRRKRRKRRGGGGGGGRGKTKNKGFC
jgi:hypothetical protein